jgi:hypothetical protein
MQHNKRHHKQQLRAANSLHNSALAAASNFTHCISACDDPRLAFEELRNRQCAMRDCPCGMVVLNRCVYQPVRHSVIKITMYVCVCKKCGSGFYFISKDVVGSNPSYRGPAVCYIKYSELL